jgi:hypothetical protein
MHNIQTAVSPHPLKIEHMLYELIYSEQPILPPPKTFTISPEKPCIYGVPITDRYPLRASIYHRHTTITRMY